MQFDIRRFDIYRKIPKDLTQPTSTGAAISILSVVFILYLFMAEFYAFIYPDVLSELYVDDPMQQDKIPVTIDISLPNLHCDYVGLDIQDDLGRHEVGMVDNTQKLPIANGDGCRFKANFKVNKVPGNFHISTHSARKQPENPNMQHVIHEVVFGDRIEKSHLPGNFNPLAYKSKRDSTALHSHDYFMKIVPTVYEDISGQSFYPFQYTYAHKEYLQYGHGHRVVPAIWFRFDLSPITVKYSEHRKPLYHFLTSVCAIIGGTFTVAGIIDSAAFTATELFKKVQLGKLS